jgi:hypothetical protein
LTRISCILKILANENLKNLQRKSFSELQIVFEFWWGTRGGVDLIENSKFIFSPDTALVVLVSFLGIFDERDGEEDGVSIV